MLQYFYEIGQSKSSRGSLRAGRLILAAVICLSAPPTPFAGPHPATASAQEAAAGEPLTSGQLLIQGSSLTLYADADTTDADQTINVGERARVRTCFGGVDDPCGSVLPGDPRVAGLAVRAELVGPEVPAGLPLETVPGGTFVLPGFQQEGDYRLENIRLVEAATGRVLGAAEPPVALLRVREIVLASATVRTLTLAELAERGITLTEDNFQAFNFAVGFAFGSEIVEIELPVVYSGLGPVEALEKPRVSVDGLPSSVAEEVRRWQPPNIVPFALEPAEQETVRLEDEADEDLRLPLFGAIVLPGNVSYLNQFFEARLIVANGAPPDTLVQLSDLGGTLRLPSGNVLRAVGSEPAVAPGQRVPVVEANGGRLLDPGEQGSAAWTVEGLVAGTHTLAIDVTGQLERPGRDPLPVLTRTQAAVEVVDARFNLTFSHPDVVREGEAYSLFVTVTNLSRVPQNLITVDLAEQNLTGAHPFDPNDDLARGIDSLEPGQAETVEFRLVAELDGKVVATTFQSDSASGTGTIRLRTGVGELGIPLSPATLVLPRFSERLDTPHVPSPDFLRSHVRFLGLAYSLAVAPPAFVPPGLPRVITGDVERRAVDLGQAGLRNWLGEPQLEMLQTLTLDQLGNRAPLAEIDELRRLLSKGEAMGVETGALLRHLQGEGGLGAVGLLDRWAATAAHADPWLAALVVPDGSAPLPTLEVRRATELGLGVMARPAGSEGSLRGLPFGEIYRVRETATGGATVPLALVGHITAEHTFEVVLRNESAEPAAGRLLLVLPDDLDPRNFRRVDLGRVDVPAGGAVAVQAGIGVADPASGGFAPYHLGSGIPTGGSATARGVDRPPFRLLGARQDFRLAERGPDRLGNYRRPNRYGNGLLYLFNRPPEETAATTAASYRIRSTFDGLDTAGAAASGVSEKVGEAAWLQDDPRVVAVRYSTPVSALVDPSDGTALLDHEHLLETTALVDGWGESLASTVPPPRIESDPLHVGALVDGRVLRGTGEPAEGATVQLIRQWEKEKLTGTEIVLEPLGSVTTGADGRFFFDFVETPHWDPKVTDRFLLRASVPEGDDPELEPADVEEVASKVRLQNRLAHVNIALLGRGVITGRLVYADDGAPVSGGQVTAASTLFNELERVEVASDGSFRLGGVPVGPVTLTGRDPDDRRVYATVGVEEPGATVDVLLELPRTPPPGSGTVEGTVVRLSSGDPVADARVAVYVGGNPIAFADSDAYGRFRFEDVPEGQVTVQAANFAVSRSAVITDLTLAAGETVRTTLRLPDGDTRTVTGSVLFHDPLTNTDLPVEGAVAFINGPGVFAYTGADGRYRIEGVPVQGVDDGAYRVSVIDYDRRLQGNVELPPILDATAEIIEAQPVVLENMVGAIDGVVLDPLGRPAGGVEVVLYPARTTTTLADGSFSFTDVPVGTHTVLAHLGDGLQDGRVGWFTEARVGVVFGGHRPFTSLRLRGGGVVTVHTTTSSATGVQTPIFYKPTWYHDASRSIKVKGSYIETTTDPNGNLELALPVGRYEIVAYNPFHGLQEVRAEIAFAGETRHHEIVFEDAATVAGRVVDVDGHTPVPDVEVSLAASGLLPQTQRTDAQGQFRFELVPKGRVTVTARGVVGTVERLGRTYGYVDLGGQTLDLEVRMKAQGTVRGRVMERFNGELTPLPFAQFYVRENAWPYRRLPADGSWFATDADGRYQVSGLYAGGVTVVARDSGQVSRTGSVRGTIAVDWEVVDLPDVVMSTSVGSLALVVRDPETGGPVADAQVRLSNGEATVSGPEGEVFFDALALGTYSVYAFHAPTGRSGRLGGLGLTSPGQHVQGTVLLDQRGEVRGTLYDDEARTVPVAGGTVRLSGNTAGGRVTALATTSGSAGEEGRFVFLGIPEGTFDLEAAEQTSPRRARAEATLTETSPVADVIMVLEPVGDVYVGLFEKLTGGLAPVDLSAGVYSVRFRQIGYDFTRSEPAAGTDAFYFPDLLLSRRATLNAEELSGEQRSAGATFNDFLGSVPLAGSGSAADPYRLTLRPKGAVRVAVFDGAGVPVAGASVTLNASGVRFPSVTGDDGTVGFAAVPAGSLTASATSPTTGTGGTARGSLTFDDEVVELSVTLAPAVSAHGTVYLPVPDDRYLGDPGVLEPAAGAIVEIADSSGDRQTVLTAADGGYRFDVLPTGGYSVTARNTNGDQLASVAGSLVGPDGNDNPIPALILDAGPPRILSITPPPGLEGVSRTAAVEIVFSEPLLSTVLPTGQSSSPYFRLASADGVRASGVWTSELAADGTQVVRFTPSEPYANFTTYSLTVEGGSGGVRDRVGRPVTTSGDIGSNFKTADGIGPQVVATVPALDAPVDPAAPIRVDFNEAVQGPAERFDGDGVEDAARISALRDDGSEVALPVALFLTRSDFSLQVEVVDGLTVSGDTLQRRLVVSGLTDSLGNAMPTFEATFRIYDGNPPVVDAVPFPDGAPDGQLVQGVDYLLLPTLSGIDDATAEDPGGDVARVDYFFSDPTDPSQPVAPSFSAVAHPFAYPFVGAYSGDGVEPRPFIVWVRAVDTSTNRSNVVRVDMEVLPNSAPTVGAVTTEALAPVAGTFYAGSDVRATVSGLDDSDGSQLTLSAELRADGQGEPLADAPDRLIQRPETGWADVAPETFDFRIPLELPEGTPLYVVARAIDSQGSEGSLESDRFPVADDATPASLTGFTSLLADGRPESLFFIGESFVLELRASDVETAVDTVNVELDRTDLFPDPLVVTKVDGTDDLYRSDPVAVPGTLVTERTPVVATARVSDLGGNETTEALTFEVAPELDPTAPTAEWITPWQGAPWPAGHDSVVSADGAALLLRAEAADANQDASGELLPGTLVSVRFRGPVRNAATGAIELSAEWVDGVLVPGTDAAGRGTYRALWRLPDLLSAGAELPFEVAVQDGGGTVTVEAVRMQAVPARRVYEFVTTAVAPSDDMLALDGDPDGDVFLLDGTTLSLRPQEDGTVRSLPAVHLYTGASTDTGSLEVRPSVLTAPEITTYDSAILYHPLELAVERALTVALGSRVDMSGRGLLGNTPLRSVVLPGEIQSEQLAGGSHGGRGGYGSFAGGFDRTDLTEPGTVYDSLRDPHLPGSGGTSINDSTPAGAGGGVVRILADGAAVRLDGDLLADGGDGSGAGGAGGAVRLVAGRLEGTGRISAAGGSGSSALHNGGGGGGRVSVSYGELGAAFDPDAQIGAPGGENTRFSGPLRRGGAGTVFLESLDPATGAPLGPGRLVVRNPNDLQAATTPLPALGDGVLASVDAAAARLVLDLPRVRGDLTGDRVLLTAEDGSALGGFPILGQERIDDAGTQRVALTVDAAVLEDGSSELDPAAAELSAGRTVAFHGRTRLAAVTVEGWSRLVADDDLHVGPEGDATVNDRAALELLGLGRALLRGEAPVIAVTASPAEGSDLLLGSSVELSWQADDPLGVFTTTTEWTLDDAPSTTVHSGEPLSVTGGPRTLTIPVDAPDGPVTYSVQATDLAGRAVTREATWTVLPNEAPTATVSLGAGATTPAPAGYPLPVVVDAADREGLVSVTLMASGPVTAETATQTVEVAGTASQLTFEVDVLATADGSEPVVLQAMVEDVSGATATSEALSVAVEANAVPVGDLVLADGAADRVKPGESTQVTVTASDPDGLDTIELRVDGAATAPGETRAVSGTDATETFTVTAAADAPLDSLLTVTAVITDALGAATTTASLDVPVVGDTDPPVVSVSLSPDATEYTSGDVVTVTASATDDVSVASLSLTIDGDTTTSDGSDVVTTWTVPPVADPTVFTISAEAADPTGNVGTASRDVTANPLGGDAVPPQLAFTCPTTGAVLPTGYELSLTVAATDDTGIARVDYYVDGATEPFARVTPDSGTPATFDATTTYLLPATATDVTFRAEAIDPAANVSSTQIVVTTVGTVDLAADGAGSNDWASLAGQTAVLRSGTLTVDQPVSLGGLIVLPGATVTHPATAGPGDEESLRVDVTGPLYVACGGAVDVSGRGYRRDQTYPGHVAPGSSSGGSHLGVGGVFVTPAAETFGSVYTPLENGGGGDDGNPGGGVVHLMADRLQVDGAVLANGAGTFNGGGGGSVWLRVGTLAGTGVVEAKGGNPSSCCDGAGGGGAVAVEYGALEAGATVLDTLAAEGGRNNRPAGAGTVYLRGPAATYGDLTVDNAGTSGTTSLPALGAGTAQTGSGGAVLVTDRSAAIPAYFTGHWVEIYDGAGGFKGAARVASIGSDGLTVTLDADLSVIEGDLWQGVYRFDRVVVTDGVNLTSPDPIRVEEETRLTGPVSVDLMEAPSVVVESGTVTARQLRADTLRVVSGASLTQWTTTDNTNPQSLTIDAGEVIVEAGATIDVSGRGYRRDQTYPGHVAPGSSSGGSHLGVGGVFVTPAAETFGSVYTPLENGGGGDDGNPGGGVVHLMADRLQVDGAVLANGAGTFNGGGGGSVWLRVGTLAGTGVVEAKGGNPSSCCDAAGGGGAVAVEYGALEAGATVLDTLAAEGGRNNRPAGAGTVYLRGPAATYGDLTVDNAGTSGTTSLPALGAGTAQTGSGGAVLVTDRGAPIPAYFTGHWVEIYDGAGGFKGAARVASIGSDGLTVTLDADLSVIEGDQWQGVYRFDRVTVADGVSLTSPDPIRVEEETRLTGPVSVDLMEAPSLVVESGTVTARELRADTLRVSSGASLTQWTTTDNTNPQSLTIDAGEVIVEAGATIDVSGRGYRRDQTYPGHVAPGSSSGGSHLGVGGVFVTPAAETFGSVYTPLENGGGGDDGNPGGGVVHLMADRLQVDGAVLANGAGTFNGGGGGSVWLRVGTLAGTGVLEAKGGNPSSCCDAAGGGGAVAVEYGALEAGATVLDTLAAEGGRNNRPAGAGTVYLRGPAATYGDLTVDNAGTSGTTSLPALGAGTAQTGSGGAVLVTDRGAPIPAYFAGHWVEVYDGAGGFKGAARVASIGSDGLTLTLDADLSVIEGDQWQGVYRFDRVTVADGVSLTSPDPIRVEEETRLTGPVSVDLMEAPSLVVESGTVTARELRADTLRVSSGASLTQWTTTDNTNPQSLTIDAGEVIVEAGATIDVSGRGYRRDQTYPGHVAPGSSSGGSHLGVGGVFVTPAAETFGSVYTPLENGGGGDDGNPGGGVVHLMADRLQVDGAVLANGAGTFNGGGGGSVWLRVGTLAGTGVVEAKGGNPSSCCDAAGGGGAVAVEYGALEAGATVLDTLAAEGGRNNRPAGAGTVYLRGPAATYGDLTVDNAGTSGTTSLPALGAGTAQTGSGGAVLVTDRGAPIPAYFAGHWVEVYDGAGGFKGAARVASIGSDGLTVTLDADLSVIEGDLWQGVYRFDRVTVADGVSLTSPDPIRVVGETRLTGPVSVDLMEAPSVVVESGTVTARELRADTLRVVSGATLTQWSTPNNTMPESLTIDAGEVIVEAGAAIDVTGRGYPHRSSYPGHGLPGSSSGGSHLGVGGVIGGPAGETFGSVYFPQENGGSGDDTGSGGGVVRIVADRVQVDGAVRADGAGSFNGGAGGSVWLQAGTLAGSGVVSADGRDPSSCCDASGGGGAVVVEYGVLEAGSTLLDGLSAEGGVPWQAGGAGTVYVLGPDATYGDLTVDNAGITGTTRLPSLGSGLAQPGSGGDVLVTDRAADVPAYFLGHWVRIETPDRVVKGTWRVGAIDGVTLTLLPNGTETVDVAEGDEWFGVYRFDSVTVTGGAVLESVDEVIELFGGASTVAAESWGNLDAPLWNGAGVSVAPAVEAGSYVVTVAPFALADADGVGEVRLGEAGRWVSEPWSAAGVSFTWNGEPGERLRLVAVDDHGTVRRAAQLRLPPLPGRAREPLGEDLARPLASPTESTERQAP